MRLLACGVMVYLTRNVLPTFRKLAVIGFGLILIVVQIGDTYVPRNALTPEQTVTGVWIFYTLFVLIAFAVEQIGAGVERQVAP